MFMKKIRYLFSIILISACNYKDNESNDPYDKGLFVPENFKQLTLDSLKPPKVIIAGTPQLVDVPIKKGNSYFYKFKDGENKNIPLNPPSNIIIPKGFTQGSPNFTTINSNDGLAFDCISCGIIDKKGSLWFGTTMGGVSHYDGNTFTNYNESFGLAMNEITSVFEDKKGNIWFGTNGNGISCFDGIHFKNYNTIHGLANNSVWCINEDNIGNIWFGTYGGGASRFDGENFTTFSVDQGLSDNIIYSIIEDKIGNIWFGTNDKGVFKYDGNRIDAIDKGDKVALKTTKDLKKHNGKFVKSFTNLSTKDGLVNNKVSSILEDKIGNIWMGTFGGGVSCYAGNRVEPLAQGTVNNFKKNNEKPFEFFTNYTTDQGLLSNYIHTIIEDKNGNIWFGTKGGGVCRFAPSGLNGDGQFTISNYTTEHGLADDDIRSITIDKSGDLWFGTNGEGLSRYDGSSYTSFNKSHGLPSNTIWGIMEDRKKNLWFGTDWKGAFRYDGNSFTRFSIMQGLAQNTVNCITEDNLGKLWFGTSGGLSCYDEISFRNYRTSQGLPSDDISCITKDRIGNLWIGTSDSGIVRYDGNRVEAIEQINGESIQINNNDLKTDNGKLVKTFIHYTAEQGLADNNITCIFEDKIGNLWFGTKNGGVSCYNGNRIDAIENNDEIAKHNQNDLKKINGKRLKSFTNYTTKNGLGNNVIYSIIEDKFNNLWFGTKSGISRFDGKSFTNFTIDDGLPNNFVTQLCIIDDGNIAIGTNFGIAVITDFTPLLTEKSTNKNLTVQNNLTNKELKNYTPLIEIYNSANGFSIKDVNRGQHAMFKDSKDILWIATGSSKTALVRFDHKAVNKNLNAPSVVINNIRIKRENICWFNQTLNTENILLNKNTTNNNLRKFQQEKDSNTDSLTLLLAQFMAFGKKIPQNLLESKKKMLSGIKFDSITKFYPIPLNLILPYKHNNVSIDFNAIETSHPSLVNYQYMLDGYENEWNPITHKRSATYGNIYEGNYTFKLKAQSPEGVWSEPIEYSFKVLPPWYRTLWAYFYYILTVFILIWLFYKWKLASLIKDKKILKYNVEKAVQQLKDKTLVAEANAKEALNQKQLVYEKQKEILDSIHYASRIQKSLLTGDDYIKEYLKAEYFILFKPKDIVAGDFYWATSQNNLFYLATCDCTGHGVPGAFMSMLNILFLNENVIGNKMLMPNEILNSQRKEIIKALNPKGNENSKDGMDCVLCAYDFDNMKLHYAAAYNKINIVRDGEIIEYEGDRMSVGKHDREITSFSSHTVDIKKGDIIYTFTDGYPDQFGKGNKKLQSKVLKKILLNISRLPMLEQKIYLDNYIEEWKSGQEQTDDILVIGVKI